MCKSDRTIAAAARPVSIPPGRAFRLATAEVGADVDGWTSCGRVCPGGDLSRSYLVALSPQGRYFAALIQGWASRPDGPVKFAPITATETTQTVMTYEFPAGKSGADEAAGPPPRSLTVAQAAEELGVDADQVKEWARTGRLRTLRHTRRHYLIAPDEIAKLKTELAREQSDD